MYLRAKNNTKMTYQETITYLFNSAPMFQKIGSAAYKEGLENTIVLDNHFNNPHKNFRIIHIAGTNGKGSCSHTLASVLQAAGYKVGLFTSPHLVDFRERIRVNGEPISQSYVIKFVEEERSFFEPLHPSFFELTTAMAFRYFAEEQVDVAIIEVGLGGRLDCTNIVNPDLSIITNISYDHTQFLGHTLAEIATEKAGIIKSDTPIIIGESLPETKSVFLNKAINMHSPIIFADEISSKYEDFEFELKGNDEFKLFIIVPIKDGFAPIGLIDKYISPKTIKSVDGFNVELFEAGKFAYIKDGKVIEKGTMCKMARGEMVRWMAERKVTSPEELKNFEGRNHIYSAEHSSDTNFVYLKKA